jgi:flagellar biogenesis protein FliO
MIAMGQFVGPLVLVLAGMIAVAILARRFLPTLGRPYRAEGSLQRLGLLALTPQCSVALVRAGQDTLVLGLTPQSVTLLTKAGEPVNNATRHTPHATLETAGEERQ